MRFVYPARLRRHGPNEVVVSFRDLPECLTSGIDESDALAEARDALEEAIAGRIDDSEAIPEPSRRETGEYLVAVPTPMAAKAALVLVCRETGLSQSDLAARLGMDQPSISRILDPKLPTPADRLNQALRALGQEPVVEVQERPSA